MQVRGLRIELEALEQASDAPNLPTTQPSPSPRAYKKGLRTKDMDVNPKIGGFFSKMDGENHGKPN